MTAGKLRWSARRSRTELAPRWVNGGTIPSPRRGEGGARSASGEGVRQLQEISQVSHPHPTLSLQGEGLVTPVECDKEFLPDRFENAVGVLQDVVVPEPQHAIAEGFDHFSARGIDDFIVLTTVEFDRQARLAACKVGNLGADRELADELGAFEPATAKVVQEVFFGISHIAAQFARSRRQAFFRQCCAPSPRSAAQSRPLPAGERGFEVRHHSIRIHESSLVNA